MIAPEFSRPVRIDTLGEQPRAMAIAAEPAERAALARRFGLLGLDRLEAELAIARAGETVTVDGTLQADLVQACVASGAPVPAALIVPFDILFRPQPAPGRADEEVELSESELDVVFYDRAEVDLGEAVAETLSLNLDPYPRAPAADAVLREAGVRQEGEEEKGPLAAALAGLKDKLGK
ncbi:MAG TPA: DUF177 domain-containing protein [Allosphingosinicella sp.]|nr:DUF177 domain-containing protein [Allosphingosinicella sp.]